MRYQLKFTPNQSLLKQSRFARAACGGYFDFRDRRLHWVFPERMLRRRIDTLVAHRSKKGGAILICPGVCLRRLKGGPVPKR